jgi:hypothetical protein
VVTPRVEAIKLLEALAVPPNQRDETTAEMSTRVVDYIIEAANDSR